jgi:hypothetical protein
LVLVEKNATSSDVSYFEITIPQRKESDFLSNFRVPMYYIILIERIIIALVIAFAY